MVSRLFISYFILVSAGRTAPAGVAGRAVAQRAAQRDDATRDERKEAHRRGQKALEAAPRFVIAMVLFMFSDEFPDEMQHAKYLPLSLFRPLLSYEVTN